MLRPNRAGSRRTTPCSRLFVERAAASTRSRRCVSLKSPAVRPADRGFGQVVAQHELRVDAVHRAPRARRRSLPSRAQPSPRSRSAQASKASRSMNRSRSACVARRGFGVEAAQAAEGDREVARGRRPSGAAGRRPARGRRRARPTSARAWRASAPSSASGRRGLYGLERGQRAVARRRSAAAAPAPARAGSRTRRSAGARTRSGPAVSEWLQTWPGSKASRKPNGP